MYKSMMLDDMGRYVQGIEGGGFTTKLGYPLGSYIMSVAHRLMLPSLVFARLYIAIFLVLSSAVFFYISNRVLRLPVLMSLAAAIFPSILPGQTLIPGFIAGSYTVPGSLFMFMSILFAHKYVEGKEDGWGPLFLFFIMHVSSLMAMLDGLFYFLPMMLIFMSFGNFKLNKRIQHLLAIVILADVIKIWHHFFVTYVSSQTPVTLSFAQIYGRVINSIYYMFPIGFNSYPSRFMTGIFIVFLLWGMMNWSISLYKNTKTNGLILQESFRESLPALLGFVWLVSGSVVFWFISPFFANRYFHLASYGAGLFVAFFVLRSGYSGKSTDYKKYSMAALMMLISLMIFNKIYWQYGFVSVQNSVYSLYKDELKKIDYPQNSQIIVTGDEWLATSGYWRYSSGYLKYITGRIDVEGNISYPELQFYNAFNPSERGFATHMTGIDIKNPVFLFRKTNRRIYPVKYALRWEESVWSQKESSSLRGGLVATAEKLIRSPWVIYQFDLVSGEHAILREGEGLDSYKRVINDLSELGIAEREILWAGPMSRSTEIRFGIR